jgi:hypothetical protein
MIRFLSDEDFDGRIVRGLLRRMSDLNLVRVQDVGLQGAGDEKLLEWTTDNNRILLTHDRRTVPRHVRDRIAAGLHVPGVLIVNDSASIGRCIDDLQLIAECSHEAEWHEQIIYLPFA